MCLFRNLSLSGMVHSRNTFVYSDYLKYAHVNKKGASDKFILACWLWSLSIKALAESET